MIYELRQYRIRQGMREEWVRFMDEEVVPFQQARGMTIIGTFTDREDEDLFVWIRRFKDESQRKEQYDAVYGSSHWQTVLRPRIGSMLIREEVIVNLLSPTPASSLP